MGKQNYEPFISFKGNGRALLLIVFCGCLLSCDSGEIVLQNEQYSLRLNADYSFVLAEKNSGKEALFSPQFAVLFRADDPKLALRPSNIPKVPYNVPSWENASLSKEAQLAQREDDGTERGDGFDLQVTTSKAQQRTADLFLAGKKIQTKANRTQFKGDTIIFAFPPTETFEIKAYLYLGKGAYPAWDFVLTPKVEGFFSVLYVGAPTSDPAQLDALWQPLIWQEKRFPDQSYLTMAFRCPIPSALVHQEERTIGVIAAPSELPFQPLPIMDNSRFGVALRNEAGQAQPILVAPVLGGNESYMEPGSAFSFNSLLFLSQEENLSKGFETVARDIMGFRDYRNNAIGSLNQTIENVIAYGMSEYSWFVDSLKGCAYSTDVPGAVKNVSSLNPLEVSLIYDREDIFRARAYPLVEYLISREKFLFSLDPEQKIQQPSRSLQGPAAAISELAALYGLSEQRSEGLKHMAIEEMASSRIRNLNKAEEGDTWQNQLAMYRATGESAYLEQAVQGGWSYVEERVNSPSCGFDDAHFFFWPDFVPDYINLYQLFEASGDKRFLDAAHVAARQFATFTWFGPSIPEDSIWVNPDGFAPHYWYLKRKGHPRMEANPEKVPAWRLSEIGLSPEAAGTCNGHRAIFMAHHAPWMLRIGYETGDTFLRDIARSAIVGRYLNFPGYHINTARTTAYEKADYPFRPHKALSVNSFHYNHIWPLASNLIDYLISDFYVKSEGEIDFPSDYIEGYAYLENKFYGHKAGTFYDAPNVRLWMPQGLLSVSSRELNYLIARDEEQNLYLAFANQSIEPVKAHVSLNPGKVSWASSDSLHSLYVRQDNQSPYSIEIEGYDWEVEVSPHSITTVRLEGLVSTPSFQHRFGQKSGVNANREETFVVNEHFKATILDFGQGLKTLYVYHKQDDSVLEYASLRYILEGETVEIKDTRFPFEWTVPLADGDGIKFSIQTQLQGGDTYSSKEYVLK